MLKKPDAKPPDDEVTQRLRAAARKRRPLTWKGLLLLLGLLLIPAGLIVWWVYPKPDPPRLDVVAFDQVGWVGGKVELRAFLEPLDLEPNTVNLGGYPLFFEEKLLPGKLKAERIEETTSERDGAAAVFWGLPETGKMTFEVRLPGDKKRRGAMDRGQAYLWMPNTNLLVVDVESTLSMAISADWQKKNPLEIKPASGAAKGLNAYLKLLNRKKEFQVVYLALAADRPRAYRKVRGWVENQINSKEPFPAGPVLGRKHYTSDGESAARQEILTTVLKGADLVVAVVGNGEAAAVCRGLGVTTILIGEDRAPEDVVRVKSWREIPEKLPKK
jgi:hypothetical protein